MARERVNFKKVTGIRYRVYNGQIQIDLNSILKTIGEAEKLSYNPQNKPLQLISYLGNKKKSISNLFKVRAGTDMTKIKGNIADFKTSLKSVDEKTVERQKMTVESVKPDRWSIEAYMKYYDILHTQSYGISSIEVTQTAKSALPKRKMKILLAKFESMGCDRIDAKKYIEWIFNNKSGKHTIGLGLLASDWMIQEWMNKNKSNGGSNGKKKKVDPFI